jgi:lipopolysaccharide export LptBFGC system permease protein LptF
VPVALKVLLWVIAIAIAVVVLFTWVFPWVEAQQQDPTMGFVQLLRAPR